MNSLEPLEVTRKLINALDVLRTVGKRGEESREALRWAINTLDEAGVFAEIDEVTEDEPTEGYGSEEFREEMRHEETVTPHRLRELDRRLAYGEISPDEYDHEIKPE